MKLALVTAAALLSVTAVACVGASDEQSGSDEAAVRPGLPPPEPADPCANLASGPFTPGELGTLFSGSEDFTFDGLGNIVAKRGNDFAALNPVTQTARRIGTVAGQTWGVRYRKGGDLLVASPGAKKIVSIAPDGTASDYLTDLASPNGLYVDHDDNVFLAEFGGRVSRIAPDGTRKVYAQGAATAQGADGIVVDEEKGILFYNEYQKGKINRIAVDAPAGTAPTAVATIQGAAVDGMLLDQCGNILVVDNGRSRLFRVRLDAEGNATAQPEFLATFPKNVAAANFGSGPGFDEKTLYVTGNPGTVYTVPLGVGGKKIVGPAAPSTEPEPSPNATH
ncbi:MAG: gluconolactonase [Labilithrix sp.]|nr:gluconolactonase [Labilithrix sp.]MCW5810658.1 gluconolactonase [Labilithrix sp.]